MACVDSVRLLDGERRELAARMAPRAIRLAARWKRAWPRLADEIESAALWGVMRAASGVSPEFDRHERNSYFRRTVDSAIQNELRWRHRKKRRDGSSEGGGPVALVARGPGPAEAAERAEDSRRLRNAIAKLSWHERYCLRRYYRDGATMEGIAAERGRSRPWVYGVLRDSCARLAVDLCGARESA